MACGGNEKNEGEFLLRLYKTFLYNGDNNEIKVQHRYKVGCFVY